MVNQRYNKFKSLPFIPYRIIQALTENEDFFKLLKSGAYDCLNIGDLTIEEKENMIWAGQEDMGNHNIFLTSTVTDEMTEEKMILKVYRVHDSPNSYVLSTVSYRFDFMYGVRTSMVKYNEVPCSRGDVFQEELMKTLNGRDVGGIGRLVYDKNMSNLCSANIGIGEDDKFTGVSVVMATGIGDDSICR